MELSQDFFGACRECFSRHCGKLIEASTSDHDPGNENSQHHAVGLEVGLEHILMEFVVDECARELESSQF